MAKILFSTFSLFILSILVFCEHEIFVSTVPLASSLMAAFAQWPIKTNRLRTFTTEDAIKYLRSYGYLPNSDDKDGFWTSSVKNSELEWALRKYQSFSGLPITGKLDRLTQWKMKQPRCGMKDLNEKKRLLLRNGLSKALGMKLRRKKRYVIQGSKFLHEDVTVGVKSFSKRMSQEYVGDAVKRALRTWEAHIPKNFIFMTFNRVSRRWICPESKPNCNRGKRNPDIELKFATGQHGDDKPFDGTGEVLAHAFYPDDLEEPGNIHFDDDEPWGPSGRNFLWVATHELGHSLGLEHSENPESLMHSDYNGHGVGAITLHRDDLRGIQKIYGRRTKPLPPQPTKVTDSAQLEKTTQPNSTPSTAPLSRPAPTWRTRRTQRPTTAPPTTPTTSPATRPTTLKPWRSRWTQQPSTRTPWYLYKPGTSRWWNNKRPTATTRRLPWFHNRQLVGATTKAPARPYQPYQTSNQKLPIDICKDPSLDAMVSMADGMVYAFKGEYYWRWDRNTDSKYFDRTPRKIKDDWAGLQPSLDAAFTDDFQYTWFFKNKVAWQFDIRDNGGFKKVGGPELIWNNKMELFTGLKSRLDAALSFTTAGGSSSALYLFSGRRYWRDANYDGENDRGHYTLQTREIAPGVARVDAAVSLEMGPNKIPEAYIFSGHNYYRVVDFRDRIEVVKYPRDINVDTKYPKQIGPDWFGCPAT